MDCMEFDCTPLDEPCVSVSDKVDYMPAMKAEANRMMGLLAKKFPNEPGYFSVKSCPHDFGNYLEIRYYYEDTEDGNNSCLFVESNWPKTWDDSSPVDSHLIPGE